MSNEIFSVQKLEEHIAFKASVYIKKSETEYPRQSLDIGSINSYIKGDLLNIFSKSFFDQIKPMNGKEAYRTLSLADNQFQTHSYSIASSRYHFLSYYHHHYLEPEHVVFNEQSYQTGFANDVWNLYTQHYHLYSEAITGLFLDFKNGLLGFCPSFITVETPTTKILKHRDTDSFISHLICYTPNTGTTLSFKLMLQENMEYFRKEVYYNLGNIEKDHKRHYLNSVRYEFELKRKKGKTTLNDIQPWLNLYHINSEDEVRHNQTNNPISLILALNTPTAIEAAALGFNKNTASIQEDFYNYYSCYYIDKVMIFLGEQIEEQNSFHYYHGVDNNAFPNYQPQQAFLQNIKMKMNLTVPQLAYCFKMLADINPSIFDIQTKKELYQFIEANFLTTGKQDAGPTVAKLNNLNSAVDPSVIKFWKPILLKMLENLRKE